MAQEYDKSIQDLLDWNICERNSDGELKPTADFLIWYYDHLIYEIPNTDEWSTADESDIMIEADPDEEFDAMTKEDITKYAIDNQIVVWTAQKIGDATYTKAGHPEVKEHVKVVYNLINEIHERVTETIHKKL